MQQSKWRRLYTLPSLTSRMVSIKPRRELTIILYACRPTWIGPTSVSVKINCKRRDGRRAVSSQPPSWARRLWAQWQRFIGGQRWPVLLWAEDPMTITTTSASLSATIKPDCTRLWIDQRRPRRSTSLSCCSIQPFLTVSCSICLLQLFCRSILFLIVLCRLWQHCMTSYFFLYRIPKNSLKSFHAIMTETVQ